MNRLVKLIGCRAIEGRAGSYHEVSVESLAGEGKVCGLYFALQSCAAFTSELVQWYNKFQEENSGENLNIVFVSLDENQADFDECFDTMPWLALQFTERAKAAALSRRFEVHFPPFMPPTLIFVDASNGRMLARDGVAIVTKGTTVAEFPWKPTDLLKLISDGNFVNTHGETKTFESIASESDFLGLYFSCRRCTPCQKFTRRMAEFYNRPKEPGKKYEVVFASFDRDQAEFDLYLSEMPWWGFPFGDHRRDPISMAFFVKESPSVVIIDTKTGEVVSVNGYGGINRDPMGKEFPWRPSPLALLDESTTVDVNSRASVIFLTDGTKEQVLLAKAAMEPVAAPYFEQHKNEEDSVMFFYTDPSEEDTGLCPIDYLSLPSTRPLLVLVDNLQMCMYVCEAKELNEQSVQDFFAGFQAGTLKKVPLE